MCPEQNNQDGEVFCVMILGSLNLERENTRTVLKIFDNYWWHKNWVYVVQDVEKRADISGKQISAQFLSGASKDKIFSKVERANSKFPPRSDDTETGLTFAGDIVEGIFILDKCLDSYALPTLRFFYSREKKISQYRTVFAEVRK